MQATGKLSRLWEIDTLRGIAIVEMVFFHFMWDLNFFRVYQTDILGTAWQSFARNIAATFIFVMGVSLTLSYTRYQEKNEPVAPFSKYFRRGAQVFGLGMLITVATYFFIGRGFVVFGILHLLGASIILAYPFLPLTRWVSLVTGLIFIGLGIYFDRLLAPFPWLIFLGIKQRGFYMVDYYPLFPWFGVALLGIFAGKTLYPQGRPRFSLPDFSQASVVRVLRFLGQHSLLIYMVHQPILIAVLIGLGLATL